MRYLPAFIAAAAALSAGASPAIAAPSPMVLSDNGRVGKVYVDRADQADVRTAYGKPSGARQAQGNRGGHLVPVTVWRYRCTAGRGESIFLFDSGDTLRNFSTSCRTWRTASGTRVGDTAEQAEGKEDHITRPACGSGSWILKSGRAQLYIWFPSASLRARVSSLDVASIKAGFELC